MIKVAYCNIDELDLSKTYGLLPETRKNKVDNFKFEKDKKLSAGAYFLLDKLLKEECIENPIFEIGEFGKAYISNYENIYFNLSHSGKLVACAISDREVGLDIELIDYSIELDIAKNFFFNSEYKNIIKSKNPQDEFFRYWVLKESYMKYTGLGFNLDLDKFEIILDKEIRLKNDNDDLKFSLFDLNDYKLAVCAKSNVKDVIKYSVDDLFQI
ncbi:4'-phosphopantetheinyl transferase superfamily protein [Methanobrevibacter sp. YE315]|uniref:4'-phosphopantetheinyl transferase family protein n=1 Tax=Methanobrevibacter sp. YE315 TaxID=1609968 RepID=UPI00082FDF53|nr:4'-phosphopantetheinyl transferase superfamily protein [Methanobrevibacter sp. YE315]